MNTAIKIGHTSSDRLEIQRKVNRKYLAVIFLFILLVGGWMVFYFKGQTHEFSPWVLMGFISLVLVFGLYWNTKKAKDWEHIRFNKMEDKVYLNNAFLGTVSGISRVWISEHDGDPENGPMFRVKMEWDSTIFQIMNVYDSHSAKHIAGAVAEWVGIPFEFLSMQEKWDQQLAKQEEEKFQKDQAHYIKHWNAKSDQELVEIYSNKEKYTAPLVAAVGEILKERKG